jgi:N-acetylmuramoyl-L-alanine amidase
MNRLAALAVSVPILLAQSERAPHSITAIRSWSLEGVTRIAIEVSGDFSFRTDRLHNPERVYFDILDARPHLDNRRIYSKQFDDPLVQRVRVAETTPGVTRIVVDLTGAVEVSTSQLTSPNRLIVELRAGKGTVIPTETMPQAPALKPANAIKADLPSVPPADVPVSAPAHPEPSAPKPDARVASNDSALSAKTVGAEPTTIHGSEPRAPAGSAATVPVTRPAAPPERTSDSAKTAAVPPETGKAARHTSSGGSSLTRALGLKVGRIVIDPGHGGHDQGTQGVKGLLEKDLVLDVALRVGKLVEERMSAEVIYTRIDDTFIPLESRTALANERKADLFLSIHANSSSLPRIAGVETFYLNFTDSKEAMDVASRENASSQKSIYELQDLIHKITLHEKLDESREFASRIQTALFTFASHNGPGEKNRGVKKAPFVVLIGASMPSVLAEIGFLTNPREETQLKKPDYRQKLAEALYRGISRYRESLSHFQLAQNHEE